jgi:four helix bundle protein
MKILHWRNNEKRIFTFILICIAAAVYAKEGFGRASSKEKIHFIDIAYGSLMEVECQIEISAELGYVSYEEQHAVSKQVEVIARLLYSLRFSIIKNGDSSQCKL